MQRMGKLENGMIKMEKDIEKEIRDEFQAAWKVLGVVDRTSAGAIAVYEELLENVITIIKN